MSPRGPSPAHLRAAARSLAAGPAGRLVSLTPPPSPGAPLIATPALAFDDPEQLLGLRADRGWAAVGLVVETWSDEVPPHAEGRTVGANVAYVLDRRGRCQVAAAVDDEVVIDLPTADVTGLLADLAARILGLPTRPEATPPTELVVRVWLQNLLDAAADPATRATVSTWCGAVDAHPAWRVAPADRPRTGRHPDDVVAVTLALGRVLTWERMRCLAAGRRIVVPGLSASDAAWMDAPFFARWTLDVHRPATELLDDLSLFLDGAVLRDVRYTVDAAGWLGFADSHAS